MTTDDFDHFLDWAQQKVVWLLGLAVAWISVIVGQADIQEPWRHYLVIIGAVAATTIAYMMPNYRSKKQSRKDDPVE